MSISHQSGSGGLKRYASLKSFNVQKWEIRFILGLDALKNTHPSGKGSNKCCLESNFEQKSPQAYMSIFPQSGATGPKKYPSLEHYNVEKKQKNRFPLGLD